MDKHVVEREIGGRVLRLETGRLAKQAAGAVLATYGDTVVLAAVVTGKPREGIDFFPLTVDYREKIYAAGKFPGGFFKREGRPTLKEILTMRNIDRPVRPMFPDGYMDELLIQVMVLSADQQNDPDILAMISAAAALAVSPVPFQGPMGAVRVGRVNGELVLNPTEDQLDESDLNLLLGGHRDGVNMIEVGAKELPDDVVASAVEFGYEAVLVVCDMIDELKSKAGKPVTWTPPQSTAPLRDRLRTRVEGEYRRAKDIVGKQERNEACKKITDQVVAEFCPPDVVKPEFPEPLIRRLLDEIEGDVVRDRILASGKRIDGRASDQLREIICEVGVLPRAHGSAIFTRGETQALVATTLGTARDEQIIDGLTEEYSKKFMLHYNFPPLCTGEVKRVGAVSRREIGHGALAERSLEAVLPHPERFPYTIRLVSDILESNGSSSMATVCAGTLALMDGGVPIVRPVAGISVGMVHDDHKRTLLLDILGEEDHYGDMDFKIAGTQRGITGIQLDLKARAVPLDVLREALVLGGRARIELLRKMLSAISKPREQISVYAPRILTLMVNPEKIGKIIGPGGKGIRAIEAATGAKVEIEDSGLVQISCIGMEGAERARAMVEGVTAEVQVGKRYQGRVSSIKDFGAFIEVLPGQDGLCHISELSDGYIRSVNEVCRVGDVLEVKVILIDDQGRVKLSRKAVLLEDKGDGQEPEPEPREPRREPEGAGRRRR